MRMGASVFAFFSFSRALSHILSQLCSSTSFLVRSVRRAATFANLGIMRLENCNGPRKLNKSVMLSLLGQVFRIATLLDWPFCHSSQSGVPESQFPLSWTRTTLGRHRVQSPSIFSTKSLSTDNDFLRRCWQWAGHRCTRLANRRCSREVSSSSDFGTSQVRYTLP